MHPWNNAKYQQLVNAKAMDGCLCVEFANGDQAAVAFIHLSDWINPSEAHAITDADLTINSYEVNVHIGEQTIVIPWDKIRFVSDTAFARHNIESHALGLQTLGGLLQLLREQRDMTLKQLSEMTGIRDETLRFIERGERDVPFSVLRKHLKAFGLTFKDLHALLEKNIQRDGSGELGN